MSDTKYTMKPEDISLVSAGSRSSHNYASVAKFIVAEAAKAKFQFLNKTLLLENCVAKSIIKLDKAGKIPYGFNKWKTSDLAGGKKYLPPLQNAIGKAAVGHYFCLGPNFIIIVPSKDWKERSKDLDPTVVKMAVANYKKYNSV